MIANSLAIKVDVLKIALNLLKVIKTWERKYHLYHISCKMFGSTVKDYIYHIACVIVGKICFIILPKCKNSIWFFSHLMYSFKSYMLYNILFQFCLTYSGVSGLSSSNLRRFCSHDDRFHRPLITDAELRDLYSWANNMGKSSMNLWYFHTLSKCMHRIRVNETLRYWMKLSKHLKF